MRTLAAAVLAGLVVTASGTVRAEEASLPPIPDAEAAPAEASAAAPADEPAPAPEPIAPTQDAKGLVREVETIQATKPHVVHHPEPVAEAQDEEPLDDGADAGADGVFRYELHGFVRGGYTFVERDPGSFAVGANSGFRLQNARLAITGGYGDRLTFDVSLDNDAHLESSNLAPLRLALRDAYVKAALGAGVFAKVGQFKAPFNGEVLLGDADVPFVRRSMLSEGLAGDEARVSHAGLGLDRQLGAAIGARLPMGQAAAEIELAVVNGNGINQGRNDNALPSVAARASVGYAGQLFGIAGYWNERTEGRLAQRQDERDLAVEADVQLNALGARVFAMFALARTSFLDLNVAKPRLTWGTTASVAYPLELGGVRLEPAYRFALYEPTDLVVNAGLMDHTIGVNIYPSDLPLRVQLNGTMRVERPSRTSPNNLVEAVVQANF